MQHEAVPQSRGWRKHARTAVSDRSPSSVPGPLFLPVNLTGENAATQQKADAQRMDFSQQSEVSKPIQASLLFARVQIRRWGLRQPRQLPCLCRSLPPAELGQDAATDPGAFPTRTRRKATPALSTEPARGGCVQSCRGFVAEHRAPVA